MIVFICMRMRNFVHSFAASVALILTKLFKASQTGGQVCRTVGMDGATKVHSTAIAGLAPISDEMIGLEGIKSHAVEQKLVAMQQSSSRSQDPGTHCAFVP